MDNDKIFASNYPLPEFYFKHLQGHQMLIDKFTVRSNASSKCGAFPIGAGIIFTADHLAAFELTAPFHRFTFSDYKQWRQERLKDPTPLRSYEPIAYFEMDSDNSLTFEPDCHRMCTYVFLKPTGFRKKPTAFTQKISVAPLEIEFFGVQGSSQDITDLHSGGHDEATQNGGTIDTQYSLELRLLGDNDKLLKSIKSVPIHSLIGFEQAISPKTLCSTQKPIDTKSSTLTGKTFLKITDSHLQL